MARGQKKQNQTFLKSEIFPRGLDLFRQATVMKILSSNREPETHTESLSSQGRNTLNRGTKMCTHISESKKPFCGCSPFVEASRSL